MLNGIKKTIKWN